MKMADYLTEEGMSAASFARQIPVLKQTFHKYLHNLAFPPPKVLDRIDLLTEGKVTANDFVKQHTASSDTGRAA